MAGGAAQSAQRYSVKWSTAEGAESCPQQEEITAAVAKLISADQFTALDRADRVIFGSVRRDESWHATLRVVDAAGNALGEREIRSDAASCSELGASVALAIALIIDPDHIPEPTKAVGAELPSAAVVPSAPPAAFPNVSPAPVASRAPAPTSSVSISTVRMIELRPRPVRSIKAGAVLLSGLLPELAVGAQLEFWQPLRGVDSLRLALAYFGAQTQAVRDHAGASARLYAVTARAAYCALFTASSDLSLSGCAGLESGLMVAHGQGGGYDSSPARGLLALDTALTVDQSLAGPWALSLTGGMALAPFRPRFSYQTAMGPLEVQRRSALEGRLEIGMAYRF